MSEIFSQLILGTVQFGLNYGINNSTGKPTDNEVGKILLTAFNNGITFLDTAEAYGDAQKRIGLFHAKHKNIRFNIITKYQENTELKSIEQHVLKDLHDLNAQRLYGYLFHNLNGLKNHVHEIDDLISFKKKGIINKIGVSLYTNKEIEKVLSEYAFIDLIQIPFNVFDNLKQKGKVLKKIKEKEIEIHTRSAFLQGLFFKKLMPDNLAKLQPYVDLLYQISAKSGMSISEIALNYCINQPLIDKVLIGVDNEFQLAENINSIKQLDNNIVNKINRINIKEKGLLNPANW